jgi:hypothetical protein
MKDMLKRVQRNLRVTKVVATRSVKGRAGDQFAGFAASYNSVQDEPAGAGKDLISVVEDTDVAAGGMTLLEARIAYYLVAMQADIAAHEAALASGGISSQHCADAVMSIRANYGKLIRRALPADQNGAEASTAK